MSTRQMYAGKGNFVPSPAKKGQPKAKPVKKRLPLHSPAPTPSASQSKIRYTLPLQNTPLESLGDLLALRKRNPNSSIGKRGKGIYVFDGEKASRPSTWVVVRMDQPQTTTGK